MTDKGEISPREAAKRLGVRLDYVYSMLWAERLAARKQEGRWFVSSGAVEARLKERDGRNE